MRDRMESEKENRGRASRAWRRGTARSGGACSPATQSGWRSRSPESCEGAGEARRCCWCSGEERNRRGRLGSGRRGRSIEAVAGSRWQDAVAAGVEEEGGQGAALLWPAGGRGSGTSPGRIREESREMRGSGGG